MYFLKPERMVESQINWRCMKSFKIGNKPEKITAIFHDNEIYLSVSEYSLYNYLL